MGADVALDTAAIDRRPTRGACAVNPRRGACVLMAMGVASRDVSSSAFGCGALISAALLKTSAGSGDLTVQYAL